jgi:hypothetical protein
VPNAVVAHCDRLKKARQDLAARKTRALSSIAPPLLPNNSKTEMGARRGGNIDQAGLTFEGPRGGVPF